MHSGSDRDDETGSVMNPPGRQSALVVGAGIAGLMAGRILAERGWRVILAEKSRGVGGRMATRRMGRTRIDHGAQFFTARNPEFRRQTASWCREGAARIWFRDNRFSPGEFPSAHYIGLPSMTGVAKHLASGQRCLLQCRITRVEFNRGTWTAFSDTRPIAHTHWLVLTAPLPQSLQLLDPVRKRLPVEEYQRLQGIRYDKCIAVMATLNAPAGLPAPGLIRPNSPEPLSLLADNHGKGVSLAPALTLHSGPEFAQIHFDLPEADLCEPLIEAARPYLKAPVREIQVHRWRYARPRAQFHRLTFCHRPCRLALAGDAFGGGRVEGAALSGLTAARSMLGEPPPETRDTDSTFSL